MKKIICLALLICCVFCMTIPANAFEAKTKETDYQFIIDKINKKYGVDFHIPTQSDLADVQLENSKRTSLSVTPEMLEQFEKELTKAAQELAEQNAFAEAEWEAALTAKTSGTPVIVTKAQALKKGYKNITGAKAYFEAYANNSAGYWVWGAISKVDCTRDNNNTSKRFDYKTYTTTKLDANRSCLVKFTGTLYTNTILGWIPGSSTQTTDWAASM